METKCVFCDRETEFVKNIYINFMTFKFNIKTLSEAVLFFFWSMCNDEIICSASIVCVQLNVQCHVFIL